MLYFHILKTVLSTITPACPIDDTHDNKEESDLYLDDLDVELDMIEAMPPPTKVSMLLAACPLSEAALGQSPAQCAPAEPVVTPPAASPGGHVSVSREIRLKGLKAARLAWQAERHLQKA
jgi:hypothetical protein